MNKFWKIIGVIAAAAIIFTGGYSLGQRVREGNIISAIPHKSLQISSPAPTETPSVIASGNPELPKPEKNIIEKNTISAAQDGWTELSGAELSLADGSKAHIKLYTSASRDTDGSLMLDDGNTWLLEAEKDGSYYALINKYIQLGRVNFIAGEDENGAGSITAVTSTGTGITVDKYTYSGTAFEGQTVYKSEVLNVRGSTF